MPCLLAEVVAHKVTALDSWEGNGMPAEEGIREVEDKIERHGYQLVWAATAMTGTGGCTR